jgi:hypothetical protein
MAIIHDKQPLYAPLYLAQRLRRKEDTKMTVVSSFTAAF